MALYSLDARDGVKDTFKKLERKNPKQLQIIRNKIIHILEDPHKFKPLGGDRHGEWEVHIDKHFVLVYSIDEENKVVILEDYDHHEAIFGK